MTPKEYVLSVYPEAECDGPVKMYWPGQGTRFRYIVTASPVMSRSEGEGLSSEEAWENAAERIKARLANKE